jgi:Rrf2 family transcriptional regulator, iron-sulfur cluster assembly transcription factor
MKLNTKSRYAIMAMVDLTLNTAPKASVSLADIAARQEISLSYLEQLFAKLRRAGLVCSVRGPGGGYQLAKPASVIFMADIVDAVDEPLKITRCNNHHKGCLTGGVQCITHDLWEALGNHINGYLASISLANVCYKEVRRAS